jgi:nuclear pore complex protein Nup98-Nup96
VNGVEDDTFEFKKRKLVPGAFGNREEDGVGEYDQDQVMGSGSESEEGSFLEDGSAGSTEVEDEEDQSVTQESFGSEIESDEGDDMDMAGSFPTPHLTAEQITSGSPAKSSRLNDTLRSTTRLLDTPTKARLDLSGDWTQQLQRTISPRKQDRAALREVQGNAIVMSRGEDDTPKATRSVDPGADKGFATSIDLMNSLFRRPGDQAQPLGGKKEQQQGRKGKGFEV